MALHVFLNSFDLLPHRIVPHRSNRLSLCCLFAKRCWVSWNRRLLEPTQPSLVVSVFGHSRSAIWYDWLASYLPHLTWRFFCWKNGYNFTIETLAFDPSSNICVEILCRFNAPLLHECWQVASQLLFLGSWRHHFHSIHVVNGGMRVSNHHYIVFISRRRPNISPHSHLLSLHSQQRPVLHPGHACQISCLSDCQTAWFLHHHPL